MKFPPLISRSTLIAPILVAFLAVTAGVPAQQSPFNPFAPRNQQTATPAPASTPTPAAATPAPAQTPSVAPEIYETRLEERMAALREAWRMRRLEDVIKEGEAYLKMDAESPRAATARHYLTRAEELLEKERLEQQQQRPTGRSPFPTQGAFGQQETPQGFQAQPAPTASPAPAPTPADVQPAAQAEEPGGGMPYLLYGGIALGVIGLLWIVWSMRKGGSKASKPAKAEEGRPYKSPVRDSTVQPGGFAALAPSSSSSHALAPRQSGADKDEDEDLFEPVGKAEAPAAAPMKMVRREPTPPPDKEIAEEPEEVRLERKRGAFQALGQASSMDDIVEDLGDEEEVSFDPSQLKRAGDQPAKPAPQGSDIHEMPTRLEADEAAMRNPAPASDDSINLAGLDSLGEVGGEKKEAAAQETRRSPQESTASSDDFTFSSLISGEEEKPKKADGSSAVSASDRSEPDFGGLFSDTGFEESQRAAGGQKDAGTEAFSFDFNFDSPMGESKPASKPGGEDQDPLGDMFTQGAFDMPEAKPSPKPGQAKGGAAADTPKQKKGGGIVDDISGGFDLTIGSSSAPDAPQESGTSKPQEKQKPKSAETPKGSGVPLDNVLFAEETIGSFITPEAVKAASAQKEKEESEKAAEKERAAGGDEATMMLGGENEESGHDEEEDRGEQPSDSSEGSEDSGSSESAGTEKQLRDEASTPEESTIYTAGVSTQMLPTGIEEGESEEMAEELQVERDGEPKAQEKSSTDSGIDLSGLDETITVSHGAMRRSPEEAEGDRPERVETEKGGAKPEQEPENKKQLTPEELKQRQQSRAKTLLAEQKKRGLAAAREGDWKQAVHYFSIASALDPSDEEIKERLAEAREKRKEESARSQ